MVNSALFSNAESGTRNQRVLRNENRRVQNVRYYKPFRMPDLNAWRLEVGGLVEKPGEFTLSELRDLPQVRFSARMVCVEGWSFRAEWEGFTLDALSDIVQPRQTVDWIGVYCLDDYYEYVSLDDMRHPRAIFVLGMNGQPLSQDYGAPLRLLVPQKYAYKSAKAIRRVEFLAEGRPGTWTDANPIYTAEAEIVPGWDFGKDIGERRRIPGGEITDY
jgi:sulfoxide reductase catalytic subunit YedY